MRDSDHEAEGSRGCQSTFPAPHPETVTCHFSRVAPRTSFNILVILRTLRERRSFGEGSSKGKRRMSAALGPFGSAYQQTASTLISGVELDLGRASFSNFAGAPAPADQPQRQEGASR